MRRVRVLSLALGILLGIGAMSASGAAAADLFVTEAGLPLSSGTPVFSHVSFGIAHDNNFNEGVFGDLVTDGKPTDKVTYGAAREFACDGDYTGCPPGWSLAGGGVSEVKMTSAAAATVTFKPKVLFSEPATPGPCVYAFSKAEARFTIGTFFGFNEGVARGKLESHRSQATCAKTARVLVSVDLEPAGSSSVEYLETRLGP